jgi:hypothetical protein
MVPIKRSILAVLALVAATVVSVPALAGGHDHGSFPMPAAEFQQKIDARVQRAREHMEKRIVDEKLTDDQAKEARARFDAVVAQVSAEVQKAVADGTVTADEAKAVRQVARSLHQGEHHHPRS